jgi:DNA-directed RNA polymerase specialized sigma subunit
MHSTDDETIAEALADWAVEQAVAEHPRASAEFRRRVAVLYLRQAIGSEARPGHITQTSLGRHLGISQQRIADIQARFIARMRRELLTNPNPNPNPKTTP